MSARDLPATSVGSVSTRVGSVASTSVGGVVSTSVGSVVSTSMLARVAALVFVPGCVLVVVLGFVTTAACGRPESGSSSGPPTSNVSARVPRPASGADSTIAAADYIGPDACGDCHADQHAAWKTSLHSVMNQPAEPAALVGDFANARVDYAGGTARFESTPAGPVMRLARSGREARYRITRTIGKRGLQEYVGVVDTPGTTGVPVALDEVRLPFGYWPALEGWFPQAYFDPWLDEDDLDVYAPVREPWAERCPWCHSTYPFEQRIARASGRAIGHGFEQYFTSAPGSQRLDVAKQVTVGISCESCHLGGRAHAAGAAIHFVPLGATPLPDAPRPTTFADERRDPQIVNRVCAQCHSGPSPRFPDGSASRNSSEALDLAASSCTTARCIDCHDPHTGGSDETRALAACTGCHERQTTAGPAHTGHATASTATPSDVTCLDCHMPRIVMGIDRYVRTHRIGSPSDRAMLADGAPNACNVCHLDRTIGWTVDELRTQYDAPLGAVIVDRDRPAGELWLASKEPAIRLVAAAAFARSKRLGAFGLADLIRQLDDPLPHVRTWTQIAIEDIIGRRLAPADYDSRAPSTTRVRQRDALRGKLVGARR